MAPFFTRINRGHKNRLLLLIFYTFFHGKIKRGGSARKRGISDEQVCILIARDRSKQTIDFVTGNGPITKAVLSDYLKPILDPDALLVSDSNPTYGAFCKAEDITHEAINLR